MLLGLAIIIGMFGACAPDSQNLWVFLVGSMDGWENYSITSNVCHAYQTVLAAGIPRERIIVMIPDDIANNPSNPYPGKIFNRPNGTDVYAGVKIDYRGQDVNIDNFLNILKGNKEAMKGKGTGRVIEGDENTNIFMYHCDHGEDRVIFFPDWSSLHAKTLDETFRWMHDNKKYNKIIYYLETCYSGSMFDGILDEDIKVYAMTAAARDESAMQCYCRQEDFPGVCMAGEFSSTWLEHIDEQPKGTHITFFHNFQRVRRLVSGSHVNIYGDFHLGYDGVTVNQVGTPTPKQPDAWCIFDSVARSVLSTRLHFLKGQITSAIDAESQKNAQLELEKFVQENLKAEELMRELVAVYSKQDPKLDQLITGRSLTHKKDSLDCHEDLINYFHKYCISLDRFSDHMNVLANVCTLQLDVSKLKREMPSICEPYKSLIPPLEKV